MHEEIDKIPITQTEAGARLDAFLAERIEGWSRARLQKLIENGDVLVNEHEAKPSYKLRENDVVEVELTEPPAAAFEPEDIPLDIIFEDQYLAVINKPAGMVVHPGAGVSSGTLANAIAWHFLRKRARSKGDKIHGEENASTDARASASDHRNGIVHRLDKDTSGLILVAKDERTHEALAEQFRRRTVSKSYIALVHGSTRANHGVIDRPIARDRWHRTKMTVAANGRNALTLWNVRRRFEKFTLLDVEIKTGRTHQIRVHLASINHPVVGDVTYNEGRDNTIADAVTKQAVQKLGRFFLHAARLAFTHPRTGGLMEFDQTLPPELKGLIEVLG